MYCRVCFFLLQKHQDSYSGLGLMYLKGMGLEQVCVQYNCSFCNSHIHNTKQLVPI